MIEEQKPSEVFEPTQRVMVGFLLMMILIATKDIERSAIATLKVSGFVYALRFLFHSRGGLLLRVPVLRLRLLQLVGVLACGVWLIGMFPVMLKHGLLLSIVPAIAATGLMVCVSLSAFYNLVLGEKGPIHNWP